MYHHDIAYSIIHQRVDARIAQAAADRLAAEAGARRTRTPADSPVGPDASGTRRRWFRAASGARS